jgi:putative ABC transport system permease protein
MLTNNIQITWRNIQKNKGFTAINVAGLSVGIASTILLFSLIYFELSFDTFHKNKDRIFTIQRQTTSHDGELSFTSGTSLAMIDAIRTEIPQFEQVVPVCGTLEPQITILGNDPQSINFSRKYNEKTQGLCVGPEFFDMFDYKWLIGTPQVLAEPKVVVLSENYAVKYFGNATTAIGQYIKVNNMTTMKVAGILENPPLNTDFPMDILFSYATKRADPQNWGFGEFDNWNSTSSMDKIFIMLPTNFTVPKANELLETFTKKHFDLNKSNDTKVHTLSSIGTFHFDERYGNYQDRTISKTKIYSIAFVGLLILLIACINFINISTAIAGKRSKEVGVRKTLGSLRSQLILQFMSETFVVVLISVCLGILMATMSLPVMHKAFDFPLEHNPFSNPVLWIFTAVTVILTTVLSGLYPAFVLSSFQPMESLKSINKNTFGKGISLRKSLIVFQFSVALLMMVGSIVTYQQMRFVDKMDPGFKKEGVFTFNVDTEYKSRNATFKVKLKELKDVSYSTFGNDDPASDNEWEANFTYDKRPKDEGFNAHLKLADAEYLNTYGMEVVAGTPYEEQDTLRKLIVNEYMVKKLGLTDPRDIIGKTITVGGWDPYPVVAVVKDFHIGTAKKTISPVLITKASKYYWKGAAKIASNDLPSTVAKIEKIYNEVYPEVVFEGKFFDQTLQNYYKAESQLGLLYRIASLLAIFIACLGVFGLVAFVAQQKTKEIGIRKVMGASVFNLVSIISKDFLLLVFISMFLAFPIGYYLMGKWLDDFVYRIEIQWWIFAAIGIVALMITMISVSYQSIKAALMNPVKSLRSE